MRHCVEYHVSRWQERRDLFDRHAARPRLIPAFLTPGGYGDLRADAQQQFLQRLADAPKTDDQAPGGAQGSGSLFHGGAQGPLRRQGGVFQGIAFIPQHAQRHPAFFFCQSIRFPVGQAAHDPLPRGHAPGQIGRDLTAGQRQDHRVPGPVGGNLVAAFDQQMAQGLFPGPTARKIKPHDRITSSAKYASVRPMPAADPACFFYLSYRYAKTYQDVHDSPPENRGGQMRKNPV